MSATADFQSGHRLVRLSARNRAGRQGMRTHTLPSSTVPGGQAHEPVAGLKICGGGHSRFTHSLPTSTVPGGCVGPNCGNLCTPTCICPPGTVLVGKECVKRECPTPQVFNPATGSCACPPGTVLEGKECVRIRTDVSCKPPLVLDPLTGKCVPRRECPPPL